MKWFKHDANANADSKLQNVLLDYGLEGYGLYWYCIELIAGKVEADNITFSLEHDARIIARNTGSTAQKVEEMMRYFITVGLFENSDGVITCMKLAKRLDQSMTSNKEMRAIICGLRGNVGVVIAKTEEHRDESHDSVKQGHDCVMQEEIRLEEIREDNKPLPSCDDLNQMPVINEPEVRKANPVKGRRWKADEVVPDEWLEYAKTKGMALAFAKLEAEKFANYWVAASGAKAVKCDWMATWRNWVLSALERAGASGHPVQQQIKAPREFSQ